MTEFTASLPMYNLPELANRNAAFWKALSEEIDAERIPVLPTELSFSRLAVPDAIGSEVLFSQTCGYPLQTIFRGQFTLLGVPTYDFTGCGAASHRSFIIVRKDSDFKSIEDLRGSRFALNSRHSNSGMNLPRIMLARRGIRAPFFGSVTLTGSHTESIRRVAAGDLDAASIDCVTYGFFDDCRPDAVSALRVLDETPESPAIPFVTSVATPAGQVDALRSALLRVAGDPRHKSAVRGLHIETIAAADISAYRLVMDYEREAADRGYSKLA
jgi:ABC-type phosphate/phosphonate transport system substrate-binding protein